MKKKLCLFMAAFIGMGLLAGCKGTSEKDENSSGESVKEVAVYESSNVKITYMGEKDSFLGPEIKLKIENLSNKNLTVQTRDVSVNDMMVSSLFSSDVAAEKTAVDSIKFLDSSLEENGITEIEKVELSFHIYNSDDIFDTIEDTETVIVKVK